MGKNKEERKSHYTDEIKRLNRISGQIEGIKKMLAESRKLEDVLIQCRAIHSALKSIESRILESHVERCIEDIVKTDKRKNREGKMEDLADLFRHVE